MPDVRPPDSAVNSTGLTPRILEARPASELDNMGGEWGFESIKRTIPTRNDILRSLLTLSTALADGSLVVGQATAAYRVTASLLFLIAMGFSLFGIIACHGRCDPRYIDDVAEEYDKAVGRKSRCIMIAAFI